MTDNQSGPGSIKKWAQTARDAYAAKITPGASYDATRDFRIKVAEAQEVYRLAEGST